MTSRSEAAEALLLNPHVRFAAAIGLIVVATIVAYSPAVPGGFIWDDDAHVTKPELRSARGLSRIWFDVGATQQYYPLLYSVFWIEHRCWGDRPVGYHVANIAMHLCAVVLVMLVVRWLLREKSVSWAEAAAYLSGAVFALHPVHVESVAWITEQKNTLSAVFYLGAMLSYLHFDRSRRRGSYGLATAFFAFSLLSKPVTVTLPAALLGVFWWLRGRLNWKRDVLPLLPWFAMSVASGLFAAWVEHDVIGAKGEEFQLSVAQRVLLPGRIVWFYLYKLFWPAELIFVYPRWDVNPAVWWQWLFPAGLLVLTMALAVCCRRSRAPLAAFLFFVGSLFPVLGFFNVYLFLYTFVADHFQYLPSLGVIALACGSIAAATKKMSSRVQSAALMAILPIILGLLTYRQCETYADIVTMYETTLRKNPDCWMAHNNFGVALDNQGRSQDAIAHYLQALKLRPNYPEACNNLGVTLNALGRHGEAAAFHRKALAIRPKYPEALHNLGLDLKAMGQFDDAIAAYRDALQMRPDFPEAYYDLGIALGAGGRIQDAIASYRQAIALRPNDAAAMSNLAAMLVKVGEIPEAIERSQQALVLDPKNPLTRLNLGIALGTSGRLKEAAEQFEQSERLQPDLIDAPWNLAMTYEAMGWSREATAAARRARKLAESSGQTGLVERMDRWMASRTGTMTSRPSSSAD